jgi:hypothetical protein
MLEHYKIRPRVRALQSLTKSHSHTVHSQIFVISQGNIILDALNSLLDEGYTNNKKKK